MDEDELKTLQSRAKYFGLDKTENFEEFKEKYLKATAESGIIDVSDLVKGTLQLNAIMSDADYETYQKLLSENTDQAVLICMPTMQTASASYKRVQAIINREQI